MAGSQRLRVDLIHGWDRLPEFAGKRVRHADVIVETEGGKPTEVLRIDAGISRFDESGSAAADALEGARDFMNIPTVDKDGPPDFANLFSGRGTDFASRRRRQLYDERYRWEPTPAEVTKLVHAIWPEQAGDAKVEAEWVRGTRKRKAPMTYDAKRVIDKCRSADRHRRRADPPEAEGPEGCR